jgi:hypothetical protein
MTQLNRIFKGLLGYNLEFQTKAEIDRSLWLMNEASDSPYWTSKIPGLFGFPILIDGHLTGLISIRNLGGTNSPDSIKLIQLSELFVLILSRSLQDQERKDVLQGIEARLQLIENKNSNIIFMSKARETAQAPAQIFTTVLPIASKEPTELPKLQQPLLVQLQNQERAEKIAIDLHNLTSCWAFLSIDDLPFDIFKSKEELQSLGSVTIFIRDLAKLSATKQAELNACLEGGITKETPHFIAMVSEPPHSLVASGTLSEALLAKFAFTQIQWNANETKEVIKATLKQIIDRTQLSEVEISPSTTAKFLPFHPKFFESDNPTLH